MALVITVTKKSVTRQIPKLYSITLNLTCTDAGITVINQDFSQNYRTGNNIATIVNKFLPIMQEVIDNYKAEQQIFTAAQLDTVIVTLKGNLVG